jgi:hypothetical protein
MKKVQPNSISSFQADETLSRFKSLSERYATELRREGVRCTPYKDPTTPHFARATEQVKTNSIVFLETALSVFDEIRAEGGSIRESRALLWRAIQRFQYVPDSQIFEKMKDDDVIEIYSLPDHFHLAWNLNLMACVSLTVEQLLCQPWWEITTRPESVIAKLMELSKGVMTEEWTQTFVPEIPPHEFRELDSEELLRMELTIKYISPLRQNGRNVAFISINSSRPLGSNRE